MRRTLNRHGHAARHPGKSIRRAATFAALLAVAVSGPVFAAPCAGFSDVDTSSAFCPSVEWVRNRAVTTGCAVDTYCPGAPVDRLAMAAFMNRLGTALTPVELRVDAPLGAVDLDAAAVVCQTGDLAVTGYPRRAFADLVFNGSASGDVVVAADLAISTDGGVAWTNLNTVVNRGSVTANQWGALADLGSIDLEVGQAVRFGVRATRGGVAGTADLTDSRCHLRVLVYSRDGTTSPR